MFTMNFSLRRFKSDHDGRPNGEETRKGLWEHAGTFPLDVLFSLRTKILGGKGSSINKGSQAMQGSSS